MCANYLYSLEGLCYIIGGVWRCLLWQEGVRDEGQLQNEHAHEHTSVTLFSQSTAEGERLTYIRLIYVSVKGNMLFGLPSGSHEEKGRFSTSDVNKYGHRHGHSWLLLAITVCLLHLMGLCRRSGQIQKVMFGFHGLVGSAMSFLFRAKKCALPP